MRKCSNLVQKYNSCFEIQHIDSELSGSISQPFPSNIDFKNRSESFKHDDMSNSKKSISFERNIKTKFHHLSRSPDDFSNDIPLLISRPSKPTFCHIQNTSSKNFHSTFQYNHNSFSSISNDDLEIKNAFCSLNNFDIIVPTSSKATSSVSSDENSILSMSYISDMWEPDSDSSEIFGNSAFESFDMETISENSFIL
eukprot:TRINITY_DN225_c0_g1_i1.p1 TRINITY_DN225_c0_g1~~TRINITY_DN225_c0_g1_i1.p1  ORF type:complete len:197 (+),score=48.49 TRINITY_DN225_c0_g1_i1:58-648(+)